MWYIIKSNITFIEYKQSTYINSHKRVKLFRKELEVTFSKLSFYFIKNNVFLKPIIIQKLLHILFQKCCYLIHGKIQ